MAKIIFDSNNRFISIVRDDMPVAEGYNFITVQDPPDYLSTEYVLEGDIWVKEPILTDENMRPLLEWNWVKQQRTQLLANSDWTQLPDVPLATKEAWATYRQALRDITTQPDPFNVTWPTPPQ